MTYFGFLGIFLVIPILTLWALARRDSRRGQALPAALRTWPTWLIIGAHCLIALVYTTPWDNYLVATRVWWYDPSLVTGLIIGYVPIEEYTFFVLQPILTGCWLLFMARHAGLPAPVHPSLRLRVVATVLVGLLWASSVLMLVSGWQPGTYLGLLLVWSLPPIMLQTAFGADILWRSRRLIVLTVLPMTLYLAAADKLAISTGVWTINPEQSVGILLLGRLPIEEFLFFFMTNLLIALGVTLVTSAESRTRAERYVKRLSALLGRRQPLLPVRDGMPQG